jgi:protein involved in plasmid replication-relaxation
MDAQPATSRYHSIGRWGRGYVRAIDLNARDLAYLRALFIFGVLANEMLHALVCPERDQRVTTDRMFLLKNPPNDYVVQPKGQENSKSANYRSLSYEISTKGVEALVDSGVIAFADFVLWRKLQANYKPLHFDHDFATGYILASIELGARQAGQRFISWLEILNRQKCPAATREAPNPFAIPYDSGPEQRHLIPDGLFGLEYPSGACFFALETDMATEQHRDNEMKNATIVRKLRAYRDVIRSETFKTRFGLPSPQILIVTPSAVRMQNMLATVARLADIEAKWPSGRFLFKAVPELARRARASLSQTRPLLAEPWHRAHAPPCDISRL